MPPWTVRRGIPTPTSSEQPYIAGSIDAPIRDALYELVEESGERLPHGLRKQMHAVASRLLHPVADAAERPWQEFSTRELMTLSLPNGRLVLGKDLAVAARAAAVSGRS